MEKREVVRCFKATRNQSPFLIYFCLGCYDAVVKLPNPTQLGIDSNSGTDERVRPRGVHFNGRGTQIIVSYLNHGIW